MDKKFTPIGEGYNINYLQNTLLPDILEVIEKSGVSCAAALVIPQMLETRIKNCVAKSNEKHVFTVDDHWKRKP